MWAEGHLSLYLCNCMIDSLVNIIVYSCVAPAGQYETNDKLSYTVSCVHEHCDENL